MPGHELVGERLPAEDVDGPGVVVGDEPAAAGAGAAILRRRRVPDPAQARLLFLCPQRLQGRKQFLGFNYKVTHHVVRNLPLTSKQKFRFGLARQGQARPKRNFCFDVKWEVLTSEMGHPVQQHFPKSHRAQLQPTTRHFPFLLQFANSCV